MMQQEMMIWPEQIPFAEPGDIDKKEHFIDLMADQGIEMLTDVTRPSITVYPVGGRGPHPAVLVCPGGGYAILACNHEGRDICAYFNSIGFTAVLLKYRCPDRRQAAYADAVRAMRMIRAYAAEFEIDPNRLGILGFSAGAHLAACVSAPANRFPYPIQDAIDRESFHPDFCALIYPAYLVNDQLEPMPEFKIDETVPPTFLLQAEDDDVRVENSIGWMLALKRAGVHAELHIYPEGGHGYGILRTGKPIADWPGLAAPWFRRLGNLL